MKAIKQLLEKYRVGFAFLIVGGYNTLIGLTLFPILYMNIKLHYTIILAISNVLCLVNAFLTSKYFVFKTKGHFISEFAKFSIFHLLYFIFNMVSVPVMVEFYGLKPIPAQLFLSLVVMFISFFWHKRVTFQRVKKV